MAAQTTISKNNPLTVMQEGTQPPISILRLLPGGILLLFIVGGLFLLWKLTPQLFLHILIGVGFIGVYPLTYLAYLAFGEDAQRKRLRDDFQLFGLVDDQDLDDTINQLYQNVYSWPQFAVYIILIIVVTIIVLLGYVSRNQLPILLPPNSMELIFYGYLGAYVFSIQELVRRYNTFDLQPQVYSAILARMLVAVSLTFVIMNVITLDGRFLQSDGETFAENAKAWLAIIAFTIGIFPGDGINWLTQQANRILTPTAKRNSELPLRNLLGINAWHESRLMMMGIDDAQNLATADIPKLLLTTQFDTQQVANWIDQAILYVKVQERIERFREAKIGSFHELQCAIEDLPASAALNHDAQSNSNENEAKSGLATILGLTSPNELNRLREYSNFPNYTHIANFYEGSGRVGSQRAEESVQKLTGISSIDIGKVLKPRSDSMQDQEREAKKLLNLRRQLHGRAKDPSLHAQMGIINYKQGAFELAKQRFSSAIALDNQFAQAYLGRGAVNWEMNWEINHSEWAIQDISRAIELNPSDAEAFNQRGLIYFLMEYPERAIEDLNRAIELDYSLAVAYYNRAIAFHRQGEINKAIADFERARVLGYNQAGLWLIWGWALLSKKAYEEAIEKLSAAIVRDPQLAEAYANRGKAYQALGERAFNQAENESLPPGERNDHLASGEAYFDQARKDFLIAIQKEDGLWATHNDLGSLELQRGKLKNAIDHYETAIKTHLEKENEIYFLAHYNLALTYRQLSDLKRATEQYQRLSQLTAARYLTPDEQEKLDNLANLLGLSRQTLQKLQKAFDLHHQLKDEEGQALASKHLGNFFQRKGDWHMAVLHLEHAAKLYAQLEREEEVEALKRVIGQLQERLTEAETQEKNEN